MRGVASLLLAVRCRHQMSMYASRSWGNTPDEGVSYLGTTIGRLSNRFVTQWILLNGAKLNLRQFPSDDKNMYTEYYVPGTGFRLETRE